MIIPGQVYRNIGTGKLITITGIESVEVGPYGKRALVVVGHTNQGVKRWSRDGVGGTYDFLAYHDLVTPMSGEEELQ